MELTKHIQLKSSIKKIGRYLEDAKSLYYNLGSNPHIDTKILNLYKQEVKSRVRSGKGLHTLVDPSPFLSEMRLIKTDEELQRIRKAADISVDGHIAAMTAVHPGMYEYELEAFVDATFRSSGANGTAYPSIVASGGNATTLHYTSNDCQIKDDTLVLLDAGAEYQRYCGDITRTFPANGTFTEAQREVYQLVLDAHYKIIDTIRPGVSIDEPHQKSIELLTEGMLSLGLLKGKAEKIIEKEKYRQFLYVSYRTHARIGCA